MTCHTPKNPTDIITYRYQGELVYVPAAPNHVQALSHARDAFPRLRKLSDASISLSLAAPEREQQFVGISAPAWPKLLAHMARYQIIDVHVTQPRRGARELEDAPAALPIPDIKITDTDQVEEPVPPYRKCEDVHDEKASYPCPPSPSPSTLQAGKRNWLSQMLHGNVLNAA